MVTVAVGSPGDRRRNFFLGLLCIVGFLYGVPLVASNLGLSAWETSLMRLALAGCTCLFFLPGMRPTRAFGAAESPDRAYGSRKRYLPARAGLPAVTDRPKREARVPDTHYLPVSNRDAAAARPVPVDGIPQPADGPLVPANIQPDDRRGEPGHHQVATTLHRGADRLREGNR